MMRERRDSADHGGAGAERRQQLYARAKQLETAAATTTDPQRRAHLLLDAELYRRAAGEEPR